MIMKKRIERALEEYILLLRRINHTLGRTEQRVREIETLCDLHKDLDTIRIRKRTYPKKRPTLAEVVETGLAIRTPKVAELAFPPVKRTVADVLADIAEDDKDLETRCTARRGQFKRDRRLLNELVEVSKRDNREEN